MMQTLVRRGSEESDMVRFCPRGWWTRDAAAFVVAVAVAVV